LPQPPQHLPGAEPLHLVCESKRLNERLQLSRSRNWRHGVTLEG
jgi:hypothetical protein